jgi:hypothetical protein
LDEVTHFDPLPVCRGLVLWKPCIHKICANGVPETTINNVLRSRVMYSDIYGGFYISVLM